MKKYVREFERVAAIIMHILATGMFITHVVTQVYDFMYLALYAEALAIYFKLEG